MAATQKVYVTPAVTVPGEVVKVVHKPVPDEAMTVFPLTPASQYTVYPVITEPPVNALLNVH